MSPSFVARLFPLLVLMTHYPDITAHPIDPTSSRSCADKLTHQDLLTNTHVHVHRPAAPGSWPRCHPSRSPSILIRNRCSQSVAQAITQCLRQPLLISTPPSPPPPAQAKETHQSPPTSPRPSSSDAAEADEEVEGPAPRTAADIQAGRE